MNKMSQIYKICFAAILLALFIILSRALSIPYLFGLPFLRVSIASSVVAFASFYLGPFYGFVVGTFGDIIGALAFPQGEFNILFTIASSLGGLLPYFIYRAFIKIKFEKKFPVILTIGLFTICALITIYLSMNDYIGSYYQNSEYYLATWARILIIVVVWLVSVLFVLFIVFLLKKKDLKGFLEKYQVPCIISSIFITYFVFKIPTSSLVFTFVYDLDFIVVYFARNLLGFFDVVVDSILCIVALNVSLHFNMKSAILEDNYFKFKRKEVLENVREQEGS